MLHVPVGTIVDHLFARRYIMSIALCVIFAALVSCGESTPTVDTAREIFLKRRVSDDLGVLNPQVTWNDLINTGVLKLREFEKTNGVTGVSRGIKFYELSYIAELEVTDTFIVDGPKIIKKSSGTTRIPETGAWIPESAWHPKGQIIQKQGSMHFRSTEKGWVGG